MAERTDVIWVAMKVAKMAVSKAEQRVALKAVKRVEMTGPKKFALKAVKSVLDFLHLAIEY